MSVANQPQSTNNKGQNGPNLPTHTAYHVRDTKDGKSFWNRIGSAWAHKDGKGFNIQLEVLPIDGNVSLRTAAEKKPQ